MEDAEMIVKRYHAARLMRRNAELNARLAAPRSFSEMLGELRAMRGLKEGAARAEEPYFFQISAPNV